MNFYNHHIRSILKSHSISITFKFCAVPSAQEIRAQGNAHCTKFESNTNRMNFEYAPGNLKSKSQNTFLSQRNKNKSGLGDFSLLKCVAIDLVSNA